MKREQFFELITSYVAKEHPYIFMEAYNSASDDDFLNYDEEFKESLKEEAEEFLRLFNLKFEL